MADLRGGVPSPCNQICVLDAEQVCVGCGRSSAEIGLWAQATMDEQLAIIDRAHQRLRAQNASNQQQKEVK